MGKSFAESLRNGRVQVGLALVCCVGVFSGAHLSKANNAKEAVALSAEQLDGTWELQSVGEEPIGPDVESGVSCAENDHCAWQSARRNPSAGDKRGGNHVPCRFPTSVWRMSRQVSDGHEVRVAWNGTVAILPNSRVELRIGKAQYRLAVHFNPKTLGLEMEQDAILTYKGIAKYRTATEMARK